MGVSGCDFQDTWDTFPGRTGVVGTVGEIGVTGGPGSETDGILEGVGTWLHSGVGHEFRPKV